MGGRRARSSPPGYRVSTSQPCASATTRRFERHYQAMLDGEIDFPQYRRQRLAEALEPWHDLDDELFAAYTEAKNQTIDGASLHPDALATLERLHGAGLRTGVLTNGPSEIQRRKLRATGIDRLVDAICISEELGVAKPDVRAFAHAAAAVGVEPADAAMVGDSLPNDVLGALAAGFGLVVWVARRDGEAARRRTPGRRPDGRGRPRPRGLTPAVRAARCGSAWPACRRGRAGRASSCGRRGGAAGRS